jgi:MFS family permease
MAVKVSIESGVSDSKPHYRKHWQVDCRETMLLYAYLPELTEDEQLLNKFTRKFTVLSFSSAVVYLAGIVGGAAVLGYSNDTSSLDDEIGTARLAQAVSFGINALLLSISWGRLFQRRPRARSLPPEQSLWLAGFRQVYNTTFKVYRHYPALKWFFVAVCFCDAATHALVVLAITYMTDQLEFSGAQNGTAILIMLLSSVPGGLLSSFCTGAIQSYSKFHGGGHYLDDQYRLCLHFPKGTRPIDWSIHSGYTLGNRHWC